MKVRCLNHRGHPRKPHSAQPFLVVCSEEFRGAPVLMTLLRQFVDYLQENGSGGDAAAFWIFKHGIVIVRIINTNHIQTWAFIALSGSGDRGSKLGIIVV